MPLNNEIPGFTHTFTSIYIIRVKCLKTIKIADVICNICLFVSIYFIVVFLFWFSRVRYIGRHNLWSKRRRTGLDVQLGAQRHIMGLRHGRHGRRFSLHIRNTFSHRRASSQNEERGKGFSSQYASFRAD